MQQELQSRTVGPGAGAAQGRAGPGGLFPFPAQGIPHRRAAAPFRLTSSLSPRNGALAHPLAPNLGANKAGPAGLQHDDADQARLARAAMMGDRHAGEINSASHPPLRDSVAALAVLRYSWSRFCSASVIIELGLL
jgi:hypothetical protein